jgi:magnesium transporter
MSSRSGSSSEGRWLETLAVQIKIRKSLISLRVVIKMPIQDTFETVLEHVTTRIPLVAPSDNVGQIRAEIIGELYDCATHLVVCDGGKFQGIVKIEALLAADVKAVTADLMDDNPPVVKSGTDQEVAAWQAVRRKESALVVVDDQGRFLGLIPPDRLLEIMLWEHEEDLSRLGGFLETTTTARSAVTEPLFKRFRHRIPWLLLGVFGAFLAADIVGQYEARLQASITLAFFMPGIVYLADAVGTQTETVIVRGLSVGVPIKQAVWRELLSGLVIGSSLALVIYPFIFWRWGSQEVAAGVSLSMLAACSTATVAAMVFPWFFDRIGLDPVFGSGPLATVVQDLLSILLYFAITSAVMG